MKCFHCNEEIGNVRMWKEGGFCPNCKQLLIPQEEENDLDEEFIVSEGKVDFSKIKEALKEQHQHLRLFKTIDGMLGLDGERYYPMKKWLTYFYESTIQQPFLLKQ